MSESTIPFDHSTGLRLALNGYPTVNPNDPRAALPAGYVEGDGEGVGAGKKPPAGPLSGAAYRVYLNDAAPNGKVAVVSFKGATGAGEVIFGAGLNGWHTAEGQIRDKVAADVRDLRDAGYEVVFVGHSGGGAAAQSAAIENGGSAFVVSSLPITQSTLALLRAKPGNEGKSDAQLVSAWQAENQIVDVRAEGDAAGSFRVEGNFYLSAGKQQIVVVASGSGLFPFYQHSIEGVIDGAFQSSLTTTASQWDKITYVNNTNFTYQRSDGWSGSYSRDTGVTEIKNDSSVVVFRATETSTLVPGSGEPVSALKTEAIAGDGVTTYTITWVNEGGSWQVSTVDLVNGTPPPVQAEAWRVVKLLGITPAAVSTGGVDVTKMELVLKKAYDSSAPANQTTGAVDNSFDLEINPDPSPGQSGASDPGSAVNADDSTLYDFGGVEITGVGNVNEDSGPTAIANYTLTDNLRPRSEEH